MAYWANRAIFRSSCPAISSRPGPFRPNPPKKKTHPRIQPLRRIPSPVLFLPFTHKPCNAARQGRKLGAFVRNGHDAALAGEQPGPCAPDAWIGEYVDGEVDGDLSSYTDSQGRYEPETSYYHSSHGMVWRFEGLNGEEVGMLEVCRVAS
jgi:hypothetical protein